MSKHTPGPWKDKGSLIGWFDIENFEGKEIAWISNVPVRNLEEAEANARLIIAAPELLEACKKALVELESYLCDCTEYEAPENVDVLEKTIGWVKDAIAKAEGGKQ